MKTLVAFKVHYFIIDDDGCIQEADTKIFDTNDKEEIKNMVSILYNLHEKENLQIEIKSINQVHVFGE